MNRYTFTFCAILVLAMPAFTQTDLSRDFPPSHDPSTMIQNVDGRYWIFTTGNGIWAMSSSTPDFYDWRAETTPFTRTSFPSWIHNYVTGFEGHFWAPDVIKVADTYYLYYSCAGEGAPAAIGLATANDLRGPWTDKGMIYAGNNAIDPVILHDDDGSLWMAWGNWQEGIDILELDPATGLRKNNTKTKLINDNVEGPGLLRNGDYYYLFYQEGLCCNGLNSGYEIWVCRSTNITGPYSGHRVFYPNHDGTRVHGPGHVGYRYGRFTCHFYDVEHNGAATCLIRDDFGYANGWPAFGINGEPDCNGDPGGTAYADNCDRCVGGNTGLYECADLEEGYYTIISSANSLNLSSENDFSQQASTPNDASQIWRFQKAGGNYTIYSVEQGEFLVASAVADGADLSFSPTAQEFSVEEIGDGTFIIAPSSNSMFVLDVPNCGNTAGTEMNLWSRLNNDCQKFIISPSLLKFDCAGEMGGSAYTDDCGTCVGGNTGLHPCATVQFENACSYDGSIDSNNNGFAGSGFVNIDNATGTGMSIKLKAEEAGTETVSFTYSNSGTTERPLQIKLNGNEIETDFGFPSTSNWTTWETVDISLPFLKGVNELELTATTGEGGPNLDQLIVPQTISLAGCDEPVTTSQTIKLTAGWNLIGYPYKKGETVETALEGIWGNVELIKDFSSFYLKDQNTNLNTLKVFEYGKGYFIKVDSACILEW